MAGDISSKLAGATNVLLKKAPNLTISSSQVTGGVTSPVSIANGGTGVTAIPLLRATDSSSGQSLPASAYTKILLGNTIFDTNSNFSSSRFTPTVPGKYMIGYQASILSTNTVATNLYFSCIFKNGSLYCNSCWGVPLTSIGMQLGGCDIVSMNGSTDYIELYFYNGNAATTVTTNSPSTTGTYLSAAWVGA